MTPLQTIQQCVRESRVELAEHAYDQLLDRLIDPEDAIQGVLRGKLVEDYHASRGEARILILQAETGGGWLHTVWDLPWEPGEPAVLVTAYRPGRTEWHDDFMRRK